MNPKVEIIIAQLEEYVAEACEPLVTVDAAGTIVGREVARSVEIPVARTVEIPWTVTVMVCLMIAIWVGVNPKAGRAFAKIAWKNDVDSSCARDDCCEGVGFATIIDTVTALVVRALLTCGC